MWSWWTSWWTSWYPSYPRVSVANHWSSVQLTAQAHPRSTWKHRPFAAHWVGDWQATWPRDHVTTWWLWAKHWEKKSPRNQGPKLLQFDSDAKIARGENAIPRKCHRWAQPPWKCLPGVTWIGRIASIHCPCPWVVKLRYQRPVSKILLQLQPLKWLERYRWYRWYGAFTCLYHVPFTKTARSNHGHRFAPPGYEKRSDGFHCAAGYVGAVEVSRSSSSHQVSPTNDQDLPPIFFGKSQVLIISMINWVNSPRLMVKACSQFLKSYDVIWIATDNFPKNTHQI